MLKLSNTDVQMTKRSNILFLAGNKISTQTGIGTSIAIAGVALYSFIKAKMEEEKRVRSTVSIWTSCRYILWLNMNYNASMKPSLYFALSNHNVCIFCCLTWTLFSFLGSLLQQMKSAWDKWEHGCGRKLPGWLICIFSSNENEKKKKKNQNWVFLCIIV